jgi:hypothetical protein
MLWELQNLKCFSNLFKLGTVLSSGGALFCDTLYRPPEVCGYAKVSRRIRSKFEKLSSPGVREWPI